MQKFSLIHIAVLFSVLNTCTVNAGWDSIVDSVGNLGDQIGSTLKDGSKLVKKGFKSSKFSVGPMTFTGSGDISLAPKLEYGYSNGGITLVGGIGDVRDGFNVGIDGSYTTTYKTEGDNLAEIIENIRTDDSKGMAAFSKVVGGPDNLKTEVQYGLDMLLMIDALKDAKMPTHVEAVIKISAGVGASAGFNPGVWKNTDGYKMWGAGASMLDFDGGLYYGYQKRKNKKNKFRRRVVIEAPNSVVQMTFGYNN